MKLLIADDHTLFRDALVQYIERSDPMSSVTLAKDFFQALEILEQNPSQDLVVLDMRMPGMNGLQGFRIMKDKFPDQPVALMSGVAEPRDVQEALDFGAVGYFPKTMSGKALLQAIQTVVDGEKFIPEDKKSNVFMPSYYADPEKSESISTFLEGKDIHFTPRELEVLSYLVDGASNKEIALALDLQIVTVKLHVRGVCRKLDAKNRTQAALKAKELGVQPVSVGA
ncbi:MAG: response regulator [Alphaproteobacteria bacterium]